MMSLELLNNIPRNFFLADDYDKAINGSLRLYVRTDKPNDKAYYDQYLILHDTLNKLRMQLADLVRSIKSELGLTGDVLQENTFNALPEVYKMYAKLKHSPEGTHFDSQISQLGNKINEVCRKLNHLSKIILVDLLTPANASHN